MRTDDLEDEPDVMDIDDDFVDLFGLDPNESYTFAIGNRRLGTHRVVETNYIGTPL